MGNVEDTASAVKGIVEAVPIYEDLARPAIKHIGQGLETVVKIALLPLAYANWRYEQSVPWLENTVKDKIEEKQIPLERIQTPKAYIAGPTIEAMRFVADEPDLKEMYANLLVTAMDSENASKAHPSYVQIISNLTFYEAKFLEYVTKNNIKEYPIVEFRGVLILGSFEVLQRNFTDIFSRIDGELCLSPEEISSVITNLARLGVLTTNVFDSLVGEDYYGPLLNHPISQTFLSPEYCEKVCKELGQQVSVTPQKGFFAMTDFGRRFCEACVK